MLALLQESRDDHNDFTLEQFARAFDRVRGHQNWKGPIEAEIAAGDRALVEQAVIWFTATVPSFVEVPEQPDRLIVRAAGYSTGPWGKDDSGESFATRRARTGFDPTPRAPRSPAGTPKEPLERER